MTPAFEKLQKQLKQLPGVGYRSAERIALHLLVEKPAKLQELVAAMETAAKSVRRCTRCGNLAEGELCEICGDGRRDPSVVCVVEHVPDLVALERSGAYRGVYHVLHGKLSPIQGVAPEDLNFAALLERVEAGEVKELILALSNDVEGEATCHYLTQHLPVAGVSAGVNEDGAMSVEEDSVMPEKITVTRIGFGLPSGGGVLYADSVTLKSALDGRRSYS
ncbi:recombination protein RecR [Nibricoccus aquaticus]|uniref:Recombination protein RecR n=1 Tax=Nibricoccus aquaticus TaxID=2576891 RepID=A0A290QHE5_9BACT|nr:recombination mediator RecR [Nibricoccus aquaticus]ATC65716.1 recombination protein RecR [Nibricoccus aquaticus]